MQPEFIIRRKTTKSSSANNQVGGYRKKMGYSTTNQSMPMTAPNQIVKKETLYNANHDLGNGAYNIEILISQNDDLVISAQHHELPDSFIIEIENMKVQHLVNEFNNDFAIMADHLKIMNKRMVLLNPVSFRSFSLTFSLQKFLNKQEEGGEQSAQPEEDHTLGPGDENEETPMEASDNNPVITEQEQIQDLDQQNLQEELSIALEEAPEAVQDPERETQMSKNQSINEN